MREPDSGFERDLLLISPQFLVIGLIAAGVVLASVGDSLAQLAVADLGLFVLVLAAAAGWANSWSAQAGRWLAVLAWIALILLAANLFRAPAILALLVIPTIMAAAVISIPAAVVITIVETCLLFLWPGAAGSIDLQSIRSISLVAIWGVLMIVLL
ncbi:MAG: hypothetical protein IT330_19275, partial [Anaerolineae bacterium]|nr:hypothetical protein [Anaerolineae bacterium]